MLTLQSLNESTDNRLMDTDKNRVDGNFSALCKREASLPRSTFDMLKRVAYIRKRHGDSVKLDIPFICLIWSL